ncbi:MAG: hypothetical protein WBC93_18675, partial [Sulfitobacter sp.]
AKEPHADIVKAPTNCGDQTQGKSAHAPTSSQRIGSICAGNSLLSGLRAGKNDNLQQLLESRPGKLIS